jgi:large subunit ribosomal protein L9
MEVILLERVGRLGALGDVVKVRDGFGRNFLIPNQKALRATAANKKTFESRRAELEKASAASRSVAEKHAEKMKGLSLTLVRQASEDGKLYGSVAVRDVQEALAAQGHEVERRALDLGATIKNTGQYTVTLTLHPDVVLNVPLQVVRNESEVQQEVPEELQAHDDAEETEAQDEASEA